MRCHFENRIFKDLQKAPFNQFYQTLQIITFTYVDIINQTLNIKILIAFIFLRYHNSFSWLELLKTSANHDSTEESVTDQCYNTYMVRSETNQCYTNVRMKSSKQC